MPVCTRCSTAIVWNALACQRIAPSATSPSPLYTLQLCIPDLIPRRSLPALSSTAPPLLHAPAAAVLAASSHARGHWPTALIPSVRQTAPSASSSLSGLAPYPYMIAISPWTLRHFTPAVCRRLSLYETSPR